MSARGFLESMRARGVFFFATGGRLRWFAPSQLSLRDLAQAQPHKAELLALVEDAELEARCAGAEQEEATYLREERAGMHIHLEKSA